MRKILILMILGICTIANAQDRKAVVIENLLEVTQTKASVPVIVNSIMDKLKQKITDIPETYWKDIEKGVDYSSFIDGARKLYSNSYTIAELEELVSLYQSGDMEAYKQKSERITPQLYQVGNDFGQETVKFIIEKIKAYKG